MIETRFAEIKKGFDRFDDRRNTIAALGAFCHECTTLAAAE